MLRFVKSLIPSLPFPDNAYDLKKWHLGKIHQAAARGDVDQLRRLQEQNKDLNKPDELKRTALHIACAGGHLDAVRFLVNNNVCLDVYDEEGRTPLMKAAEILDKECMQILLESGASASEQDWRANTALHFVAHSNEISMAEQLIYFGAEVNARNFEQQTPLGKAVECNNLGMAELLLLHKADVNCKYGDATITPLMEAAFKGNDSMVRLLLKFGADVMLEDNFGQRAKDYAELHELDSCLLAILEAERLALKPKRAKGKKVSWAPSVTFFILPVEETEEEESWTEEESNEDIEGKRPPPSKGAAAVPSASLPTCSSNLSNLQCLIPAQSSGTVQQPPVLKHDPSTVVPAEPITSSAQSMCGSGNADSVASSSEAERKQLQYQEKVRELEKQLRRAALQREKEKLHISFLQQSERKLLVERDDLFEEIIYLRESEQAAKRLVIDLSEKVSKLEEENSSVVHEKDQLELELSLAEGQLNDMDALLEKYRQKGEGSTH